MTGPDFSPATAPRLTAASPRVDAALMGRTDEAAQIAEAMALSAIYPDISTTGIERVVSATSLSGNRRVSAAIISKSFLRSIAQSRS